MYKLAAIWWGILLLESFVEDVIFIGILGRPQTPQGWNLLTGLAFGFICGGFGNGWYLTHARREIARVRSQRLPGEQHLRALSRRGGTNIAAPLGFLVTAIAVEYVIMLLWDEVMANA